MSVQASERAKQLLAEMPAMTEARIGAAAVENARRSLPHVARGNSLQALRGTTLGDGHSAIIIAAGPSIKRRDPAVAIRDAGYTGAIICTDSSIYYCLRNGLVPDLVVTLDPHATRIVRWFGDPELDHGRIAADDYFRRQDMDERFANEVTVNREVLALLDQYGPRMRIALSTSASEAVVNRVLGTGMEIFWWNPMLDDPERPDSVTRQLQKMNGFPSVNAGGNVGAACWMMADAVLGIPHIALTGIDFSYHPGTPLSATQYYHEAVALVGGQNVESLYFTVDNPHDGQVYFTDPAYMWYREVFLEMLRDGAGKTYNCTEGGILYGPEIEWITLTNFLSGVARSHR